MRAALGAFTISLTNIRNLANDILANSGAALGNPAQLRIQETQRCGATVLLSGYFETFLREVVRAFVTGISASSTPFTNLPDVIQHVHYEMGGKALSDVSLANRKNRPTRYGTVLREDIAARLHSPFDPAINSYSLVWEAFANTGANPGPRVIESIGKNLHLRKIWKDIASKSGSGLSEAVLTQKLADLIALRNECAHTGTSSTIPTPNELIEFADKLEIIANGLVSVFEDELRRY